MARHRACLAVPQRGDSCLRRQFAHVAHGVQEDEDLQQEVAPQAGILQLQLQQLAAAEVLDCGRGPISACSNKQRLIQTASKPDCFSVTGCRVTVGPNINTQ